VSAVAKKQQAAAATVDLQDFTNHPVANFLGVRIVSVTRKRVHAEMCITPSHINRAGRVGGGMIMAFADILGARPHDHGLADHDHQRRQDARRHRHSDADRDARQTPRRNQRSETQIAC
jgi:hypothetical protein